MINVINTIALRKPYTIATWHLFFVSDNETFEGRLHCNRVYTDPRYYGIELYRILNYDQAKLFIRLSLASSYDQQIHGIPSSP